MSDPLPVWAWVLVSIAGAGLLLLLASWISSPARFELAEKVVIITGGSSGIGKAIAKHALQQGAHVVLLARRIATLNEAAAELLPHRTSTGQRLTVHSVDVTNEAATAEVVASIAAAHSGCIDAVIHSAGTSQPRRLEEATATEFMDLFHLNVVGARNIIVPALSFMSGGQARRKKDIASHRQPGGRIMLISSQAGQAGLYGYTAYSSSKFALQGFAQALQQEVYTRDILVSQCFPPDTDTPLLAAENLQKPLVTRLLSESTATVSADTVGAAAVNGLVHWRPAVPVGFDGWMLATLTCGMGPAGTLLDATVQVLSLGLWRTVALLYVQFWYFWIIARNDGGASAAAASAAATAGASGSPKGAMGNLSAPLVAEDSKRK